MSGTRGQGELFSNSSGLGGQGLEGGLELTADCLKIWQKRLQNHQAILFKENYQEETQTSLFSPESNKQNKSLGESYLQLDPLKLNPLPIHFWKWPKNYHHGPAIYLVMDLPDGFEKPILLYVGETIEASKRWKGEHDCKTYLAAYSEALSNAKITINLSIRFWTDVPSSTKARRKLEQELIQRWLPPFNKETRARWATPFTS